MGVLTNSLSAPDFYMKLYKFVIAIFSPCVHNLEKVIKHLVVGIPGRVTKAPDILRKCSVVSIHGNNFLELLLKDLKMVGPKSGLHKSQQI